MNRRAIIKGDLFNLLHTDIIHIIYMCLVVLEHYDNLESVVKCINSPHSPILRVDSNHIWGSAIFFGKLFCCHPIKYEFPDRRYHKYGWEQHIHVVKHKNILINQVISINIVYPSYNFHKLYTQYIDSRFLCTHTRFTCCPVITGILF